MYVASVNIQFYTHDFVYHLFFTLICVLSVQCGENKQQTGNVGKVFLSPSLFLFIPFCRCFTVNFARRFFKGFCLPFRRNYTLNARISVLCNKRVLERVCCRRINTCKQSSTRKYREEYEMNTLAPRNQNFDFSSFTVTVN